MISRVLHVLILICVHIQEMMVDYVVETMCKAVAAGAAKGGKATTEDVIFTVRKVSLACVGTTQHDLTAPSCDCQ